MAKRGRRYGQLEYQSPNSKFGDTATVWYGVDGRVKGVQRENPCLEDPRVRGAEVCFDEGGARPKLVNEDKEIPRSLQLALETIRRFRASGEEVHIVQR